MREQFEPREVGLLGEPLHELADDVKQDDRENEGDRKHKNHDWVDAESLAVVGV